MWSPRFGANYQFNIGGTQHVLRSMAERHLSSHPFIQSLLVPSDIASFPWLIDASSGSEVRQAGAAWEAQWDNKTFTPLRFNVRSLRADAVPNGSSAQYCVVMAHEAIAGAVNESGTYRAKGPRIDDSLDVTYWALGDIHKPFQQMAPNAWYSGSPIQNDFGYVSRERGALLVDLDAPTQPQRLLIGDAVTPLITLADEPDEWPTDAIIRFEGTPDEIAARTFPANVVAFKPVVTPSRLSDTVETSGYAMLEGVEDVMVGLVPDTLQSDVIECLKSAIETV